MYTFTNLINGYLAERIFSGVDGDTGGTYTEVFIDPTNSELRTLGPARGKTDGEFNYELRRIVTANSIEPPFFHFGGILANTHWYVWDRNKATHAHIARELKGDLRGQTGTPFYGWFFPSSPTYLFVDLATYSMSDKEVNFKAICRAHPKLKPYTVVDVQ